MFLWSCRMDQTKAEDMHWKCRYFKNKQVDSGHYVDFDDGHQLSGACAAHGKRASFLH